MDGKKKGGARPGQSAEKPDIKSGKSGKTSAKNAKTKAKSKKKPKRIRIRKTDKPRGRNGGPRANSGGKRAGAGRPAFVPTQEERELVARLARYGLPQKQIAVLVREGVCLDTLQAHFGRELDVGKASASATIGQTLYEKAMTGDTTALIWWTKTQMGWHEVQKHEVTGADGAQLQLVSLDPALLSLETMAEIMAAADAAAAIKRA